MCRMMEEMRNEAEEKAVLSTWIKDIQKLILKAKMSTKEAIDFLEIPDAYRDLVLEGINKQS